MIDASKDQGGDSRVHQATEDASRRGFLVRAATGAGAVLGAASIAEAQFPGLGRGPRPQPQPQPQPDPLNNLPSLYPGWNKKNFTSIREHEFAHVFFLRNALGSNAFDLPLFQNLFRAQVVPFAFQAREFENVGVSAYLGAAPLIFDRGTLAAAGSILAVEAYHSGYLNTLLNADLTPDNTAFVQPRTPSQVGEIIAPFLPPESLTFVMGLVGAIATTPSANNDIAILRFALALEYLEAVFYDLNVPRLFA